MTQRAFLVGTIGLCFYLISVTNSLPAAFSVLTWLALSLLLASAAVALLSLQGLKCRFRVTRGAGTAPWPNRENESEIESESEIENDLAPQLEVRLENGGTLNKTGLVLTVTLRAENAAEIAPGAPKKSRVAPREYSRRFVVEALTATKSLTALLPLDELPRGVYHIEEIRITGSDVLGLFRVIARYSAKKCGEGALRITVAPAYMEARGASTRGETEGARRGERGTDDELRGTRPYVAGDDLRAVHWKTTARLGRLVVREFDATARRRTFIVWDGIAAIGDAASTRVAPDARTVENAVEQSLRLTMSLCAALSARGDDCALLRLDSHPQRVAAGRAGFLTRCGEALCGVAADRIAPLSSSALLKTRGAITRGDELFVVAPRTDEALAKLAASWSAQGVAVPIALLESAVPRASTRAAKNAQRKNAAPPSAADEKGASSNTDAVADTTSFSESRLAAARSNNADSSAANVSSYAENRSNAAPVKTSDFATSLAATALANTRGRVAQRARRGEIIENGAPLFGETTREFAAQLRAAGARVIVVEAGGDARETIENAISQLLSSGGVTRRAARKSADEHTAFAETAPLREAVS